MTQKWKVDPELYACPTKEENGQVKKMMRYDEYRKYFLECDPIQDWESFERCKSLWNWCMKILNEPDTSEWSVLDVGTKDGQMAEWLQGRVENIIGIDVSEPYIKYAQEKGRPVKYGDVCNLDFPDESFDFVFAHHLLGLTSDFCKGLSEMFRVLRKGGYMATCDNIPGNVRKHFSYVDSPDTVMRWLQKPEFDGHKVVFFDRNPYNKDLQGEVILLLKKK